MSNLYTVMICTEIHICDADLSVPMHIKPLCVEISDHELYIFLMQTLHVPMHGKPYLSIHALKYTFLMQILSVPMHGKPSPVKILDTKGGVFEGCPETIVCGRWEHICHLLIYMYVLYI